MGLALGGWSLNSQVFGKVRLKLKAFVLNTMVFLRWNSKGILRKKHCSISDKVIVTLTSYPPRFETLHLTLMTLLTQNAVSSRVILWIADEDYDLIPDRVLCLINSGLEIRRCSNHRSYDKLVHGLKEFPNSYFVIADDDVYYQKNWLYLLLREYQGDDKQVICHRAHRIKYDADGAILPYSEWQHWIKNKEESEDIFATGIGGVLYPPGVFLPAVVNSDLYRELCPTTDDVWFYFMATRNGASVKTVGAIHRFPLWPNSELAGLQNVNVAGNGNDEQIKNIVNYFRCNAVRQND